MTISEKYDRLFASAKDHGSGGPPEGAYPVYIAILYSDGQAYVRGSREVATDHDPPGYLLEHHRCHLIEELLDANMRDCKLAKRARWQERKAWLLGLIV